jgi:ferredoxin
MLASITAKEMQMHVNVDYNLCDGNAVCMGIVPEVFEVRDDGFLYILNEEPSEELRTRLEESVRSCPAQAISITE